MISNILTFFVITLPRWFYEIKSEGESDHKLAARLRGERWTRW